MVQSQKELKDIIISELQRIKSTSNQMSLTKDQMSKMDPEEVFDWEVEKPEEALKELDTGIDKNWSKSKNANELNKASFQKIATSHLRCQNKIQILAS